jgi:hypothetical protein
MLAEIGLVMEDSEFVDTDFCVLKTEGIEVSAWWSCAVDTSLEAFSWVAWYVRGNRIIVHENLQDNNARVGPCMDSDYVGAAACVPIRRLCHASAWEFSHFRLTETSHESHLLAMCVILE